MKTIIPTEGEMGSISYNFAEGGSGHSSTVNLTTEAAVLLMVKNLFISQYIFAHPCAHLHIADHGGTYSIFTSVCTAEVWAH